MLSTIFLLTDNALRIIVETDFTSYLRGEKDIMPETIRVCFGAIVDTHCPNCPTRVVFRNPNDRRGWGPPLKLHQRLLLQVVARDGTHPSFALVCDSCGYRHPATIEAYDPEPPKAREYVGRVVVSRSGKMKEKKKKGRGRERRKIAA
jgi:hypothetical protein